MAAPAFSLPDEPEPTGAPLAPLRLAGRELLPIVQGGMGICISASRLAGAVAREGAVGTISALDLRNLHEDLLAETEGCRDPEKIHVANAEALRREIAAAKRTAGGRGLVAVNLMRAVTMHDGLLRVAAESGADAIVVGAGLPLDLPERLRDFPDTLAIPILSDSRAIGVVLRKWMRKNQLPAAIVIESPARAGGHLGAAGLADISDGRFDFDRVLGETAALRKDFGIEREPIALVVAGGVSSHRQVRSLLALGADAVQLGTAFAVTTEGDASLEFKRVLAGARPEDIVEFQSATGLPARAVLTPWLRRYLGREKSLRERAAERTCATGLECLVRCGLRDGDARMGQFCIERKLVEAFRGDVLRGLFFRGAGPLPFGSEIRPVRDLIDVLMTGGAAPSAE